MDAHSAPFFEGCRAGELRMQQCAETGRLIFPPRPLSPWAPHAKPTWTRVSGGGTIWSFVVPHPPLLPPFSELAPYNVILVALDEDPRVRLVGNLLPREGAGIDAFLPSAVPIGARVRVVFEAVSDEITLPRWVLDD
jgi:uncharacterized OB-fold protein